MRGLTILAAAAMVGLCAADEVFKPLEKLEASSREKLELAKAIQYEGGFSRTNDEIIVRGATKKRAAACWNVKLSQAEIGRAHV